MVSPRDAMESVTLAVAESGEMPADISVLLHEADTANDDADVDIPLLEVMPDGVDNVVTNNTDLVGFVTDGDGNRTGRIYESEYEMSIEMNIWTSATGGYDVDDLGESLRKALYPYSSYGPQQDFVDSDGEVIDEITYFRLGTGDRVDEILESPTVRKWSQNVELWGSEKFRTTEDYITDVSYPASGDFNDTDDDGVIDNK